LPHGKVPANFFDLRVKFAATLPRRGNVAAKYKFPARQFCWIFTAKLYLDFATTLPRQFFFSWTAILPRTYRALYRDYHRNLYRAFYREYSRGFTAIQAQILPRLYPLVYHNYIREVVAILPQSCC
jgi:hypothetical protein